MDPADEPLPAGDILDLIDEDDFCPRTYLFVYQHQGGKIPKGKFQEPVIVKINIMEIFVEH